MIDFTLLGTAATMPLPDRALSAAVLRCGGRTILFDCGEGTQTAARRAHVSLAKTDLIALTHYHGDHIFGLAGLLQTLNCLGRVEPLYITGPEGLSSALAPILALAGETQYEIRLVSGEIKLAELNPAWSANAVLTPFATNHRVASAGYAFTLARFPKFLPEKAKALGVPVKYWGKLQRGESVRTENGEIMPDAVTGGGRKGLKIVFSGDTAPCDELTEGARGADLLVCDATYAEDSQLDMAELYGHSTFSQSARTAKAAGVKRLWLTHYSQMIEKPESYLENAREIFLFAECGYDGKTEAFTFSD